MENKEEKEFYRSLPKKELQDLCKRYGLSPYMTKSNLVNSLYSYFKMKNSSSVLHGESSSLRSTSLIPPLQCGAQSDNLVHARKDCYGNVNCPGVKDNRENHSETVKCNELGSFVGAESYSKASGIKIVQDLECPLYNFWLNSRLTGKKRETLLCSKNEFGCNENGFGYRVESPKIISEKNNLSLTREVGVRDAPEIQSRNSNPDACLAENASTSSIKSSKAVPSFEFYVSSEKGINVIVDLNSSPSEWSKRMESEVCDCHTAHHNKFGSLHKELEHLRNTNKQMKNSFIWNTASEHEMNNGHVQAESSSNSIKREYNPAVVDHPHGVVESLRSSPVKPCNVAMEMEMEMFPHLEENRELSLFFTPNSSVQNHGTSGTESCPIERETIRLESSVINTTQIKSFSNSVVNSTPEGPKSLDSLEHQHLEVADKNCKDLTLQNICSYESPSLVQSSSDSLEKQWPEVVSRQKDASCSPCRNDGFLDVVDPILNAETIDDELANSSTCQDHMSACAEEWDSSKFINGEDTSEFLQLKKSLAKTSEDSEADEVLRRKRQYSVGEDLNVRGKLNARILRSRKNLLERMLPRRSMWLVSKV